MAVVDASFLVAAWNDTEPNHRGTQDRLKAHSGPLRVNAGALAEASQVIRRTANAARMDGNMVARTFLASFLSLPGASIETSRAEPAWARYLQKGGLSFVDAWVIEQAVSLGEELWAFDEGVLRVFKAQKRASKT